MTPLTLNFGARVPRTNASRFTGYASTLYAPKVRFEMLSMPRRFICAQIASDHGRSRKAEPAEQDRVGIVFEHMAAPFENFEVAFQRFEVVRVDRAMASSIAWM